MLNEKLINIADIAIQKGIFPGCAIGVIKNGNKEVLYRGSFEYSGDVTPVSKDSLFDVASVTKSIPVSMLALKALEIGYVNLDTNIKDILPELSFNYSSKLTLYHLLTHTVDYGYSLSSLKNLSPQEILNTIFSKNIRSEPGSVYAYSNASSIILGIFLERIFGESLITIAEKYIFSPCKMNNAMFNPPLSEAHRIVPTEIDSWRNRKIKGEIHDESAYVLNSVITPGSAGLFGTLDDFINFSKMMLSYGEFEGKHVFDSEIIRIIPENYINIVNCEAGLGWELNAPYMGKNRSNKCIGKTGFTGCVVIIDFLKESAIVILSNYTWPKRKPSRELINKFRAQVCDIVFS